MLLLLLDSLESHLSDAITMRLDLEDDSGDSERDDIVRVIIT